MSWHSTCLIPVTNSAVFACCSDKVPPQRFTQVHFMPYVHVCVRQICFHRSENDTQSLLMPHFHRSPRKPGILVVLLSEIPGMCDISQSQLPMAYVDLSIHTWNVRTWEKHNTLTYSSSNYRTHDTVEG